MKWMLKLLTSSIGRKLIMALTGLFLIIFLLVHLAGNLQLFVDDGGVAFNDYSYFMTTNPLIKFASYGLYFFILLHAIQGIVISLYNRQAKQGGYKVKSTKSNSFASRNMALLGLLVLVFLGIHMGDFWFKMKFGDMPTVHSVALDLEVKNLYYAVNQSFDQLWIVIVYVVCMIGLAFHLWHGFQSAFQTMGWTHPKYMPLVQTIGKLFSIIVPLGFALIPIYYYLT